MLGHVNKSITDMVEAGDVPPSMFNMGGKMPDPMFQRIPSMGTENEPTPEELEEAAEKARYSKELYITRVCVKNFNLSNSKDAEDYCLLYQKLYNAVSLKTVLIKDVKKEFINHPGADPYSQGRRRW